ncbi:GntR family transcriptional regulator [Kocuria varians]|uniref:GntR family transcriptional regulator n=1 Tax=Kocuria varians TaxID=1272 RepID=UPI000839ADA9|nr:GntR family transcriptional regulator [Kocuria varians]
MAPNAADDAYQQVKARILTGALDGQLLSEGAVAAELGVSRTPVREAFLRLQVEGLMRLYPKRGALVVPVGPHESREVLEARRVVECASAASALRDPALPGVLEDLLDQQRAAAGTPRFEELDTAFHAAIVDAAGNSLLSGFYRGLRDRQIRLIATAVRSAGHRSEGILEQHEEILRAVRERDALRLEELLQQHLHRVYEGIVS